MLLESGGVCELPVLVRLGPSVAFCGSGQNPRLVLQNGVVLGGVIGVIIRQYEKPIETLSMCQIVCA